MSCGNQLNDVRGAEPRFINFGGKMIRGFDYSDFTEIEDHGGVIVDAEVEESPEGILTVENIQYDEENNTISFFVSCPETGDEDIEVFLKGLATLDSGAVLALCGLVVCRSC